MPKVRRILTVLAMVALAMASTTAFSVTPATAAPRPRGFIFLAPGARWTGTVMATSFDYLGEPLEVTLEGTLTAPYFGRATFTLHSGDTGTFLLTTRAGTIGPETYGAGFYSGSYPGNPALGLATAQPETFTGKFAELVPCVQNCAAGGTFVAFSTPSIPSWSTDPIPWSGPMLGTVQLPLGQ